MKRLTKDPRLPDDVQYWLYEVIDRFIWIEQERQKEKRRQDRIRRQVKRPRYRRRLKVMVA